MIFPGHTRILTPVVKAAKTIKRHQKGIMNYIDSSISYGVPEGINSIVQSNDGDSERLSKWIELYDKDLPMVWEPSLQVTHMKQ
jgi:hypothetical protein